MLNHKPHRCSSLPAVKKLKTTCVGVGRSGDGGGGGVRGGPNACMNSDIVNNASYSEVSICF